MRRRNFRLSVIFLITCLCFIFAVIPIFAQKNTSVIKKTTSIGKRQTSGIPKSMLLIEPDFSDAERGKNLLKRAVKTDEFDSATPDDIKFYFDNFFIQLNNDPTAFGVIEILGNDRAAYKQKYWIIKATRFRKLDLSRLTFIRGDKEADLLTRLYIIN